MEIGLHIADFTFPNGPAGLRDDLTRIVTTAEEVGFTKVSVMDHPSGKSVSSVRPNTRCSRRTPLSATSPPARRRST
jgi:alkanesulfonate monooxygenase SsuD/methylene tetrahydromethanopterin reductase-like flavin-dependent oxidoreductase (luciferase family)